MYKGYLKRFCDFSFALVVIVIISPLFLVILILAFTFNKGNPFFLQKRSGRNGVIFTIIKFRTMNNDKDSSGRYLPDSKRLHFFGKFLRKSSMDEIPQLLNVLLGDMSIVGPRPLLPEYIELYNQRQARRHEVNPGITGWAQVNGRNAISWEQKFEFDVWYVENQSFLLDCKIFFMTIGKLFLTKDVNMSSSVTAEPFKGNLK